MTLMATVLLVLATAACARSAPSPYTSTPVLRTDGMAGMGTPTVPPVRGYVEGQEILFIHTEASDPQVAQMLTAMMSSPVWVVPSLAQAPEVMLAKVYVFRNGIPGNGPLGFQADVFDRPPGHPEYSPLRAVYLVTWRDGAVARELRSAEEVKVVEAKGEVTVERSSAVVNMPFITWPDGQR